MIPMEMTRDGQAGPAMNWRWQATQMVLCRVRRTLICGMCSLLGAMQLCGCGPSAPNRTGAVFGTAGDVVLKGDIVRDGGKGRREFWSVRIVPKGTASSSFAEDNYLEHSQPLKVAEGEPTMSGAAIWEQTSIVTPEGKGIRLAELSVEYLRESSIPYELIPPGGNTRRQTLSVDEVGDQPVRWDLAPFATATTRDGRVESVHVGFWVGGDSRVRALGLRNERTGVEFQFPLDLAGAKALFGEPSAVYEWKVSMGW